KMSRQQLRVAIGEMQQMDVSERGHGVDGLGSALCIRLICRERHSAGGRDGKYAQKLTPVHWILAFAGMTHDSSPRRRPGPNSCIAIAHFVNWIPAFAGM